MQIIVGLLVVITVMLLRLVIILENIEDFLFDLNVEREIDREIPPDGMDLLFFKRKHRTVKPTDKSRNWITARETASRG